MIGTRNNKTFGQRRTKGASELGFSSSIRKPRKAAKSRRQSARESHWCVCYIHATEFGHDELVEAIMLDLSESGARIRCRSRARFPEQVRFRAPRLGLDTVARRVWQNGFDTGIAFEG